MTPRLGIWCSILLSYEDIDAVLTQSARLRHRPDAPGDPVRPAGAAPRPRNLPTVNVMAGILGRRRPGAKPPSGHGADR